jgi:hypothetical protein
VQTGPLPWYDPDMTKLNNVEIIILYLGYVGPVKNTGRIRKVLYRIRNNGSLVGWNRGKYTGYFTYGSCASWTKAAGRWWGDYGHGWVLTEEGRERFHEITRRTMEDAVAQATPPTQVQNHPLGG